MEEPQKSLSIKGTMVLIAYINVAHVAPSQVIEYTKGIEDSFGKLLTKYSDVELIYVPTMEGTTRVEMITL